MSTLPLLRARVLAVASTALALLLPAHSSAEPYKLPIDSEMGKKLSNLPANSWVRLNLNEFQNVWTPLDQRPKPPQAPSVGGPWSVLDAWSSMAWDSNRGNLIFWGGGHANYPGNEVYRWMASDLRWERSSLPSEVALVSSTTALYEAVDGPFAAPISAHTYDSSEFLPLLDRFITFGGAAFNTGHYFELQDGTRTGPYLWDPSRANPNAVGGTTGSQVKPGVYTSVTGGQMWNNRNNLNPAYPGDPKPGFGGTDMIDATTAYAQENGKDVMYISAASRLSRFTINDVTDPTKDTYELVGQYRTAPFSGTGTAALDPFRKIFFRTANTTFTYWTLTNPGPLNENKIFTPTVSSGTFPFANLQYHGADFDPLRRTFLIWGGQRDVWRLDAPADLATGNWVLTPLSPASPTAPDLASATGTRNILGKWKYIRALDVFLGVIDRNKGEVWAYKPANWQPQVTETLPFVVAPSAGSTSSVGSDVQIVVDSVDTTVSQVATYVNGVLVDTANAVPRSFSWTPPAAGSYTVTVRTTGAEGVERVSPPVTFNVANSTNAPPSVALTSPSAGQGFIQGGTIALAATASDSDGTISRVEFHDNGTKLGEDTTSPYSFSWTGATVGSHTLTAVAYDNGGASKTSASVVITVAAQNAAPTVSLTSPTSGQSFTLGGAITLAATASDSDGTIGRVEFYANGAKVGEDTTAPYSLSWNGATLGSQVLTAVAYDNNGASKTSSSVTVSVVSSGGTGDETTVTLQDGRNGYTGARDAHMYEYHSAVNFGGLQYLQDMASGQRLRSLVKFAIFQSEGGPVPDGATIVSASLSLYKYSYYDTKYQLRPLLTNWVEGEVTWNQSRAGTPWAGPGATGAGTDVSASYDALGDAGWDPGWLVFDVTGGVRSIGQGRANHGWVLHAVSGNSNAKNYYSSEYTTDTAKRPMLSVRYTNGGTPGNVAPSVALTSPTAGQGFLQGNPIDLAATASDSDGSVSRVDFLANGAKVGEDTTAPYSFTWTGAGAGSQTITAVAYDNSGASTTSAAVVITVTAPNVAPNVALTSPSAGQSFTQGSAIGLAATASDSDGTIARVEFYDNGVKLGEDTTAPYTFSWAGAAVGSHTVTAVAYDNSGASKTSAGVAITVVAQNVLPTVALTSPSGGQSFVQGSAIALAATASDSDGTIGRVEFYANGVKLGEDTTAPYTFSWSGAGVGSQVLTAIAYDNTGASKTSATVTVSVVSSGGTGGETTLTLQDGRDGYSGSRDAHIYEYHSGINFGGLQYLQDMASGLRLRSLVKFAVFQSEGGPVPDGATIVSATLSLYKYSYYDYKYQLRPLLTHWVESEVTWNQSRQGTPWASPGALGAGTDVSASYDALGDTGWDPGWLVFDVTAGIRAIGQGRANHGWVLHGVSGNSNAKNFYSSEYTTDITKRPVLTIRYQ